MSKLWNAINSKAGNMEQEKFNDICKVVIITIVATILVIAYWNWLN